MYAHIHASLHRQAKALELLCQLLEEEYGILLSRRADDVAGLEFSIQELIRQLAVEKVTVVKALNGMRVTAYAAGLCAAGREAEGEALRALAREVDRAEQRASRQASRNSQLALALLDQSSRSLQALTRQALPVPADTYGRKGGMRAQPHPQAAFLSGRL
ncbi:flagellar export chaperone FlgN [Desulfovibrio legallii]|uniref:FlgN protein n=1 Tax=Desulfovibrio legallii TaxID=571438 RepID=A0A1G7M7I3_9BACT|nr:flagellar export chaperone FlgN [Desulfovibrio legallii]SDF57604.1 FlgN protein [Desulfovibrio legallii]